MNAVDYEVLGLQVGWPLILGILVFLHDMRTR